MSQVGEERYPTGRRCAQSVTLATEAAACGFTACLARHRRRVFGLAILGFSLSLASAGRAQTLPARADAMQPPLGTRAERIACEQAEKARALLPQQPNTGERVVRAIQNLPFATAEPRGLYPTFGGLVPGSGWFQPGISYRKFFGDAGGWWNVEGSVSNAEFWSVAGNLQMPELKQGRLAQALRLYYLDAPALADYGLGNDSSDARSLYELKAGVVGVRAGVNVARHLQLGGRFIVERLRSGSGADGGPTVEGVFPRDELPGLGVELDYLHSDLYVDYDWRQSRDYSRHGGHYRFSWSNYVTQNGPSFNFQGWEAFATQFIPVFNEFWVIALRGLVTWTDAGDVSDIPFYMLPTLGGGQQLRSFPDYRFRDRHRLLFNAEYRWRLADLMDMVLFYDAGKVAADTSDLDLANLHASYGVGFRYHGQDFTALRVDVAYGDEGWRVNVTFGSPFKIRIGEW